MRAFLSRLISRSKLPLEWRRVAGNSGWLIVEKGVRWTVSLVVGVSVARYLGPSLFGQLGYAQAVVGLFATLVYLGTEGIVVRELVRKRERRPAILATALWLRGLGSAIAFLAALSTAALLDPGPQTTVLVAITSLSLLTGAGDVVDLWFQAELRARRAAVARSVALLVGAAVRIGLIVGEAPIEAFAWTMVFESLLASIALSIAFFTEANAPQRWFPDVSQIRSMLAEAWPNLASNLATMAYMRVDRVMLGEMAGDRETGLYTVASTCVEIWYFLPMTVASSATPLLTKLRAEDRMAYLVALARLARWLALSAWILAALLSLIAPWLAGVVFGEAYQEAAPVIAILAWGMPFVFLGVAVSPWYLNESLLLVAMRRHLLGMILNAGLNLLWIPSWGAAGAAWASLVAFAVTHVFANALDPRTRPILRLQLRALLLRPQTHS